MILYLNYKKTRQQESICNWGTFCGPNCPEYTVFKCPGYVTGVDTAQKYSFVLCIDAFLLRGFQDNQQFMLS